MQSGSRFFGYHITTDPKFQNKRFGITDDLANEFEELHSAALDKRKQKIIRRLTNLILEYPKVPQLKNFLSIAYNVRGNYEKAVEINKWILSEHPDYLFGKINAAHEHINKGAAEKVPQILGEYLDVQALYPERDMFHLSEVTAFNKLVVRYYAAIGDQEMAHNRMKILEEIAPDHPDTRAAKEFLFPLEWMEIMKHSKEVQPMRPSAPAFKHAQINDLYRYGIRIPQEIIREILGLDRETLIEDLEKVLEDAIATSEYLMISEANEDTTSFPLHAISLLAELKATNSLGAILNFLESHEEELDFWLGDHLTTTVWMHLFSLSQTQGQVLKDFLLKPGVNTFSRTAATQALAQTAIHYPAKRSEIELIFKEVLSFYNQAEMPDDIVDIDFVGLLIADIVDCGFTNLLPEIESLYKKNRVDMGMNGPFADVETAIHNPAERARPIKIQDIFELYTNVLKTWAGYSEVKDFDDSDVLHKLSSAMPVTPFKTGRNDPCPCGSGKKYKKCCMNK